MYHHCEDHQTGKNLADDIREYHIPDFSNWQDCDAYELEFANLLADLRRGYPSRLGA